MTRTQIQLPDEVYRRAKRLAELREISMAELVRRGLELILSQYPEPAQVKRDWQLPAPRNLGWRGLSHAEVKDLAQMSETEAALIQQTT
jgi:hypothetical protein